MNSLYTWIILFLCCFKAYGLGEMRPSDEEEIPDGYRIICLYNHKEYYREPSFSVNIIDPYICTHVNYEFAVLNPTTYEMEPGDEKVDKDMYEEAVKLKLLNPKLKVMLSLGGWEDSTKKYSELVEAGVRVDNFIDKAVAFLKSKGFDGLDVAWEYPNCWQGALGISPKDKKNYAEFLEKLRKRFDREGLILSISVGAIKREIIAAYDGPRVSKAVHHINVMTYDMHGPWERETGHHTQFDTWKEDKDPTLNAKSAIQVWIDLGVERKKLNLGVATYAKTFTLADPNQRGIGAPTKGAGKPGALSKHSGSLCYHELCQYLNAGNWTEDEEKSVGFYAYSGDQWACYDPPLMMVRKTKWMVMNGLGGILIKDSSCDDYTGECFKMSYPLTRMIKMEMIHRVRLMEKEQRILSVATK